MTRHTLLAISRDHADVIEAQLERVAAQLVRALRSGLAAEWDRLRPYGVYRACDAPADAVISAAVNGRVWLFDGEPAVKPRPAADPVVTPVRGSGRVRAGTSRAAGAYPIVARRAAAAGPPRKVQVMTCTGCGAEGESVCRHGGAPREAVHAIFARKGWKNIAGERGLCPACVARLHEAHRAAARQKKEPAMAAPAAPTPATSDAIVSVYMHLSDQYDRARRAYKPGWSDARISQETGLAEAAVAKRREADFGPIVADTFLADLEAAVRKQGEAIGRIMDAAAELTKSRAEVLAMVERRRAAAKEAAP